VVPVAFDQDDNARRAVLLGCARMLPFKQVTAGRLAAELEMLLGPAEYETHARSVGERLRREAAASKACDQLERMTV
jgi:UDP:flavonoid glycosyltransferase YjiC (YdhE family)